MDIKINSIGELQEQLRKMLGHISDRMEVLPSSFISDENEKEANKDLDIAAYIYAGWRSGGNGKYVKIMLLTSGSVVTECCAKEEVVHREEHTDLQHCYNSRTSIVRCLLM